MWKYGGHYSLQQADARGGLASITMFSKRENNTKDFFVKRTAQKYSYNHDFIMNASG